MKALKIFAVAMVGLFLYDSASAQVHHRHHRVHKVHHRVIHHRHHM